MKQIPDEPYIEEKYENLEIAYNKVLTCASYLEDLLESSLQSIKVLCRGGTCLNDDHCIMNASRTNGLVNAFYDTYKETGSIAEKFLQYFTEFKNLKEKTIR